MRRRSQILRRRGTQQTVLPSLEDTVDEDPSSEEQAESTSGEQEGADDDAQGTVRGGGSYAASETDSIESFTLKVRVLVPLPWASAEMFRTGNKLSTRRTPLVSEYGSRRCTRRTDQFSGQPRATSTLPQVAVLVRSSPWST